MSLMRRQPAFLADSEKAIEDSELRRKLANAAGHHLDAAARTRAEFPRYDDEREAARRIKTESVSRLDELLLQFKQRLEANGCHVFFAADPAAARKYIVDVARRNGLKRAVKGKSMTTEEIELNPALEKAGLEVVETDLGEYIVQLRHERPSHILTPAIHLSKEDVGTLYHERFGTSYTSEPERLTAVARDNLRSIFMSADLGITGVNFAIAETGTLVLVENEGNGRFSSTLPDTFVAVMGIEKVIPRLADLSHFLEVLARAGTGQKITTYTNFITRPRARGELDGPREIHVVILDNGRSAMLADPVLREALHCLRCGACLNACPVYRRIGGHAYGYAYQGPIGSVVSPSLFGRGAGYLPFASTLCGACREICPVKIDIPKLLLHLRWKENRDGLKWPGAQAGARRAVARFARMAQHPRRIRMFSRIAAWLMRPIAHDGYVRWMPPPFNAWTRTRDFPVLKSAPRRKPAAKPR
jgi:L-lactate dehydrogenase complex protein LldF